MDGVILLQEARRAGLTVALDEDRLIVRGPRQAEPLARMILDWKAALMPLLRQSAVPDVRPADLPERWRERYEERAAIREYDGGQAREHAEAEALAEIVALIRTEEESDGRT